MKYWTAIIFFFYFIWRYIVWISSAFCTFLIFNLIFLHVVLESFTTVYIVLNFSFYIH